MCTGAPAAILNEQKSSCAGKFSDVNYPYNDERKTSIPPQPEDEKAGFIFAKRTENKMRKAILCLIFATALFGQPTGVQVDLSVVSVDSGSGEVCFKADARPDGAIFDGTDDHISVPDHADLNFDSTGDFTIEAWFKVDAVGRQNPIVCKLIGSNPNFTGYQMWVAPDNKLKAFICDGSYTLVASNTTVTANTWYYAAFTVDRDGNEKIYLNGALDCTPVNVSGVGNINTDTTLWIGRATHSPSLAFDGAIAEVRISDVARTDAEIADAYADGGCFENDANTIALWHLNEGTGTTAGDSSGNGHNGTLTNGAAWGNGVIVNPIQGATWTTGPLPTPPEFTFDYDWENDATYDLTDAGDSVCHTYTPGDSLLAKVKATTATYTAENSAEVIVPEGEEITIEPTLLFSIPIPAGNTVALGEPTEDGRFPVSFTFGGMDDGVIRIYDTTGAVVDSFPNAYGRDFDISPNGNLVFLTECLCSDSLNGGVDNPYVCQRLYSKEGDLLFETTYCIYCKFSEDGSKLGRASKTNVLYDTEWDINVVTIVDTEVNVLYIHSMRASWTPNSKIYESALSKNFIKIWKIGIDTLWIYDDEKNVLAEVPNFWGSIKPEGDFKWHDAKLKIDNDGNLWRIATIGTPEIGYRPIKLLATAYDTSGNQISSLSADITGLNRVLYGVTNNGDYLWILETLSSADSCRVFSTNEGLLLNAFTIPISHDRDSTNYNRRYTSIAQTQVFKLPDNQVLVASYLVGLAGMGRILVSDGFGNSLIEIPSGNREDYQITGDGKYLFTFRDNSIYMYRIWR
jgi:hypothetical protein